VATHLPLAQTCSPGRLSRLPKEASRCTVLHPWRALPVTATAVPSTLPGPRTWTLVARFRVYTASHASARGTRADLTRLPRRIRHRLPGLRFVVTPLRPRIVIKQSKIADSTRAALLGTRAPRSRRNSFAHKRPIPMSCLDGRAPASTRSRPDDSFGAARSYGSCNNRAALPGQVRCSRPDFPALTKPVFQKPAELARVPGIGPVGLPDRPPSAQTSGSVVE